MSDFYSHPQMKDGHLNICIPCKRTEAEERRQEKLLDPVWVAKEAERQRQKEKVRYPATA